MRVKGDITILTDYELNTHLVTAIETSHPAAPTQSSILLNESSCGMCCGIESKSAKHGLTPEMLNDWMEVDGQSKLKHREEWC